MTKWIAMLLAALAAGLSFYLTITTLSGVQPIGCGEGLLDCESVLSTRWSTWLGMPVSAVGVALYTTLAGVIGMSMRTAPPRLEVLLRRFMLGLICMVAASSLWFLALQFVVLREFCLYCLAIHTCGLLIGVFVAIDLRKTAISLRELSVSLAVGLVAGAVLVGGQISSLNKQPEKERYRIATNVDLKLERPIVIPWEHKQADTSAGYIDLLEGQLRIRDDSRPMIGNPDAPLVAAKLFDYTCAHCRRLHQQLEELTQRSPQAFGFVLIHLPLSPECNPYRETDSERHAQACELTRLALAVWLEKPASFVEFDRWLCAGEKSRSANAARTKAAELIGSEQLELQLEGKQLEEMLVENVDLYGFEQIALLPSLLTRERIIGGSYSGVKELEQVLRQGK